MPPPSKLSLDFGPSHISTCAVPTFRARLAVERGGTRRVPLVTAKRRLADAVAEFLRVCIFVSQRCRIIFLEVLTLEAGAPNGDDRAPRGGE